MEDLVRQYSNKSYQGTILTRVLERARTEGRKGADQASGPKLEHKLSQRLDAETVAQVVQEYEAGASTTLVRRLFSLSQGSVIRILQQHGVETRFQGLSEAEIAAARQLYESGLSLAQVGVKLDRASSTVRKALLRAGVPMRPRNSLKPEQRQEAVELRAAGWTIQKLADRYGVGKTAMRRALLKHGA